MTTFPVDSGGVAALLDTAPVAQARRAWDIPVPAVMLGVVASFVAVLLTAAWLWQSQRALMRAHESHEEFKVLATKVSPSGELLAATLRLYLYSTTDNDMRWKLRWTTVERREERLLEQVKALAIREPNLAARFAKFQAMRAAVEDLHERLFGLVRRGRWLVAVRDLDSAAREEVVQSYRSALNELIAAADRLQERRVAAAENRLELAALVLAATLILLGSAWIVVLLFAGREQRRRLAAEEALRTALAEQERKVAERTRELQTSNTELQRRGATLIEEIHLNNAVLENMDQGVLFVDAELRVLVFNQRLFEIHDLPGNCINSGAPFAEYARWIVQRGGVAAPSQNQCVADLVARARRRCREPVRFELTRADGAVIEIRSRPLAAGGFVAVISDHTELRRAERQLREVVDKLPCGIVMADMSGAMRLVNAEIERNFGYRQQELLGREIETLLPDIGDGKEVTGRRKDGGAFSVDVSLSVIDTPDGPMSLAAVLDVTERNKLQAQLLGSQKLQSIGQLAAGIAHEINTPIQYVGDNIRFLADGFSGIIKLQGAYAELLAAEHANSVTPDCLVTVDSALEQADWAYLKEEVPAAISQSQEGVERVADIVRAMKEFSHPGGSRKQSADLNHLLETTATVARNEWKYVADLDFDLDPTLPPVLCRPGEIGEVILNLLVNAAHAIGDLPHKTGTALGRITLSTTHDAEFAEIRITDTGGGIPVDVRTRVFDPFFTTKAVGKGTGQGLAIARSVVVDKHGGTIDFETHDGEGTTFIVRLPLDVADAEPCDEAA